MIDILARSVTALFFRHRLNCLLSGFTGILNYMRAGLCIATSSFASKSTDPTSWIPRGLPPSISALTAAGSASIRLSCECHSLGSRYSLLKGSWSLKLVGCSCTRVRTCREWKFISRGLPPRVFRPRRRSDGMVDRQVQIKPAESSAALFNVSMSTKYAASKRTPKEESRDHYTSCRD